MSMMKATASSSTSTEQSKVLDKPIGFGAYGVVWNVLDPRNGKRVALKKITNVFVTQESAIMVFRELRMLCTFKHENVLAALEVVQPSPLKQFEEVCVLTELLHSDLHRLIWSKQPLSADHIQVLMYQIMRGLKYIHSARVIHRDIKPGNILVYNNCVLKIGDFGMARAEVSDVSKRMSLDVVTPNYRAPEIIMEAKHYTCAIDVWAAACVLAELLGREALFNSRSHVSHLNQVIDLLGTPPMSDIFYASESMKNLMSRASCKPSKIYELRGLSPHANEDAVDLLYRMLKYNPIRRISASEVMDHPYMIRGRRLYHMGMCKCCSKASSGVRLQAKNLEPVASKVFDDRWEREITSMVVAKRRMHQYITNQVVPGRDQLCINPRAEVFKKFAWDA